MAPSEAVKAPFWSLFRCEYCNDSYWLLQLSRALLKCVASFSIAAVSYYSRRSTGGPDPYELSKQFSGCPRSLAFGERGVISRIGPGTPYGPGIAFGLSESESRTLADIRVVIRLGERPGNLLLFERNGASQANHARESTTCNRLDIYTDTLYRLPVYMKY